MARKTRKPTLALPTVAHKRAGYDVRSGASSRGASILFKAFNEKPEFVETECGDRVRVWGKDDWRHMTNADVAQALRGKVGYDHDELLEWLPPQTIKDAVSRNWLAQPAVKGLYYVTHKAALDLDLPRSVGGRKIRFVE